jgi:hypothetical protein
MLSVVLFATSSNSHKAFGNVANLAKKEINAVKSFLSNDVLVGISLSLSLFLQHLAN